MHWTAFLITYKIIGWCICAAMILVVLRRQLAPGASLAWLGIVFLHPYVGLALYLLVGQSKLPKGRAQRQLDIVTKSRDPAQNPTIAQHRIPADALQGAEPMVLQAQKISGLPVLSGNGVEFLPEAEQFTSRLIADIQAARKYLHFNYYIFADDAIPQRVAAALIDASRRGVKCRVLADAVASRPFFHRSGLGPKLAAAGVQILPALPLSPLRRRFARMDLRNHRKLAIIDGKIAFAGSHNLINPDYGGRHGNPWVDITGRFTGPVVGDLALVFAEDWAFGTDQEIELPNPDDLDPKEPDQNFLAQVVPTGPTNPNASYRRLLLAAIQCSRHKLILTTPYFVPDEAALLALMMAADRGVDVKLIVPAVADHFFAAAAGRAHYFDLLDAGVSIHLYRGGIIHSKTATVDDSFSLFGSANFDVRSFLLNFELTLLLYGSEVTNRLRAIQDNYLANSTRLTADDWSRRSIVKQYADSAVALLSPLL